MATVKRTSKKPIRQFQSVAIGEIVEVKGNVFMRTNSVYLGGEVRNVVNQSTGRHEYVGPFEFVEDATFEVVEV